MAPLPQYKQDREYESPIHEYRVDLGLTVKELAEKAETYMSTISALANGSISPLYLYGKNYGKVKPAVTRLANVLRVSFEKLFPRYFCELTNAKLTDNQIIHISNSNTVFNLEKLLERKEQIDIILNNLDGVRKTILIKRIDGYTLDEIGEFLELTRERVRQLEANAIRKIRWLISTEKHYMMYKRVAGITEKQRGFSNDRNSTN